MLTVLGCDDDEPNRKYKKHEADVNHICKRGVENKTKVTSGKLKLEILTEDIAEGPDQDGSFHHDSEIKEKSRLEISEMIQQNVQKHIYLYKSSV